MKIGIIAPSNANPYAAALFAKLTGQGQVPRCVICAEQTRVRRVVDHWHTNGVRSTFRRVLRELWPNDRFGPDVRRHLHEQLSDGGVAGWDRPLSDQCRERSVDCIDLASANSPQAMEYVSSRGIDLLLNAGGEILRQGIIDSPRVGILNAHMGRLPAFRGMNVLEWSVFEGQPAGVTVHFIDQGIDTGDGLLFRELAIGKHDTLEDLRSRSIGLSVDLMSEAVALLETRAIPRHRQPTIAGRQYFVMHPRLRALAERRLRKRWPPPARTTVSPHRDVRASLVAP